MHTLGSNAHRNSLNVGLQRNTRGDSDARKCSPIDAEEIARSVITVLGEHEVMEVGRRSGWVKRSRKIHPAAWIAAIVSTLAGGRVQWIADTWRTFQAFTGATMSYKPFHKQLAKAEFPESIVTGSHLCLSESPAASVPK